MKCPECADNHIKMLAHQGEDGKLQSVLARCQNGHVWNPSQDLHSDEKPVTLDTLRRRDNDI